jgi:hypothetical protein
LPSALAQADDKPTVDEAEEAILAECRRLEEEDKNFIDPHAEHRARCAEYGTMSDHDREELKKALQDS